MPAYSSVNPTAAAAIAPAGCQCPVGSNEPATVVLPATPNEHWHLGSICWSYSAGASNGQVSVTWGSGWSEVYYITNDGPGMMRFHPPKRFPVNTAVTITLAAGGPNVRGSLYPQAWTE